MTIEEAKPAPDFILSNQDGEQIGLKHFRGHRLVLYFYPKDDTPGCTKQACGFKALFEQLKENNTMICGVSPDDASSHKQFIKKFKLPFMLLSDPGKQVMQSYGAWGEKNMYGKKMMGVIRSTTLIDEQGKVIKHWKKVPNALVHPQKVLDIIQLL